MRVLEKLLSLLCRETLPLAANGVKKNSCTNRQKDKRGRERMEKRKDHVSALPLLILKGCIWGTWVAQSVEHLTSTQVMISQSVGSSPTSGSVLTAQSLEPADPVSPSLSASSPSHFVSLCLSKINKCKKKKLKKFMKSLFIFFSNSTPSVGLELTPKIKSRMLF